MEIFSIYATFPTRQEAMKTAEILIKERLIACANIFPIDSIYIWNEQLQKHGEFAMIGKTIRKQEAIKRIKELHSYEVPCIVINKEEAEESYAKWVSESGE